MSQLCLVTGATGYIGGRLIPRLLAEGVRVRVLVRHPERISQHPWHDQVEIVVGTADDPDVSDEALRLGNKIFACALVKTDQTWGE